MLTKRRTFNKEFKLMIINLVNSGRKASNVPGENTIKNPMIGR